MFVLVKDKNMCTRYYIDEDTPEFNDAIEKALSSPLYTTIKHKYATSLQTSLVTHGQGADASYPLPGTMNGNTFIQVTEKQRPDQNI